MSAPDETRLVPPSTVATWTVTRPGRPDLRFADALEAMPAMRRAGHGAAVYCDGVLIAVFRACGRKAPPRREYGWGAWDRRKAVAS